MFGASDRVKNLSVCNPARGEPENGGPAEGLPCLVRTFVDVSTPSSSRRAESISCGVMRHGAEVEPSRA